MSINARSPFGAPKYSSGSAVPASVATMTALKAVTELGDLIHGNEVLVDADQSRWYWHSTSALTGDDILVATPAAAPSAGRWLRCPGAVDLALPIAFGTADGAVLLTIPTGARFKLESAHWEVTTGFTGGSSSAIGVASSLNATAGDILGGAGGDVTATLGTAGIKTGTIGAIMDTDAELHAQMYVAASNFTFERIASAYTAGAGYVHLVGTLLRNAGA